MIAPIGIRIRLLRHQQLILTATVPQSIVFGNIIQYTGKLQKCRRPIERTKQCLALRVMKLGRDHTAADQRHRARITIKHGTFGAAKWIVATTKLDITTIVRGKHQQRIVPVTTRFQFLYNRANHIIRNQQILTIIATGALTTLSQQTQTLNLLLLNRREWYMHRLQRQIHIKRLRWITRRIVDVFNGFIAIQVHRVDLIVGDHLINVAKRLHILPEIVMISLTKLDIFILECNIVDSALIKTIEMVKAARVWQ
mmetsp:Transcript_29830/g.48566  ORF Transcript_29830/g.48566 Transcript_29830/m.48566 type:complete len:254 (+) Transcript_29830:1191-1952(+)